MKRLTCAGLACACVVLLGPRFASAGELAADRWRFTGENPGALSALCDRRIETDWTSESLQHEGVGFTIDFGRAVMLHRIQIKTGAQRMNYPRSLRLVLGDARGAGATLVACENVKQPMLDPQFRFNPAQGRYLRIEIGSEGAGFPWSVAELHVYGFDDPSAFSVSNAVVLPAGRPAEVREAARDLAYYAGEVSGQPVAVAGPEEAGNYRGLRFVVEPPKPGVYKPDDFIRRDLEAVQVSRQGDEVHFAGQTDWAVMYGIFQFLDAQGVRWLYPGDDGDGDYVSRRGPLDLTCLPLSYAPQFVLRYWQGGTSLGVEGRRWFAHTHWNKFFNGGHAYRNFGHHSFGQLMPAALYQGHPDWFPLLTDEKWAAPLAKQGFQLGQRLPYSAVGTIAFCTSSTEAREYIVQQAVQQARKDTNYHSLRVGEDDATQWCECPRCRAQDAKASQVATSWGTFRGKSERLFDLAGFLARRLAEDLPDRPIQVATMAYSQTKMPPVSISKLPDNVSVDVVDNLCIYLPVASAHNKDYVDLIDQWHAKASHLGIYTHHLLATPSKVPFVGITTLAEWFRFWKTHDVDTFMPEVNGDRANWRCNPWMYYAHARLMWRPDEPAAQIIGDFFKGYYCEAAEPMQEYYLTLEKHVRENDLLYGGGGGIHLFPTREIFTDAIVNKLAACLTQAERAATDYRTRQRVADAAEGFAATLKLLDIHARGK